MTGGTVQTSSSTVNTVNTALNGVENRLARSQPGQPTDKAGGASAGAGAVRTKAAPPAGIRAACAIMGSTLHQRHAGVVLVHKERGEQADGQIDRHRDGDDLDRL